MGHMEAITSYLKDVCSSTLSKTTKIELLSGRNDSGAPALYYASFVGDVDLFACFINSLAEEPGLTDLEIKGIDKCLTSGHYMLGNV